MNVSAFVKEDCQTMTVMEPTLNEKLFIANKNLKEALLDIDNLSKANKELYDRNLTLSEQN